MVPDAGLLAKRTPEPWTDPRGRPLFPLEFPNIQVDPGVFVPTQGSYLIWKYLYREGIGRTSGVSTSAVAAGC